jgi:hypothetical protein
MDILPDVLDRVHLSGTLLFHYELGRPWSVALPQFQDAVFHYLSRGSAIVALQDGRTVRMAARPLLGSQDEAVPAARARSAAGASRVVRHGGGQEPFSTMICDYFSLSRPSPSGVLELLPPILHLRVHPQVFVQPSPQRLQLAQEAMMLA